MPRPPQFLYTGIEVSDFDRSLRFYRDVLRMKPKFVTSIKETRGKVSWLASPGGDQVLELNWYPSRDWVPGSSLDHLGFVVDDAAAWQRRIIEAGGREAPDAAVEAENFFLRFAFDPDGVPIELIQMKSEPWRKSPRFVYSGLRVTDLARSAKWYQETFGMRSEGEGFAEWTDGKTHGLVSGRGKQRLELNWYPGSYTEAFKGGGSELDHLAFVVDDVDPWHARLVAAGCKEVIKPFDEGRWRLSYVEGPDGECIELGTRKKRPAKRKPSRARGRKRSAPSHPSSSSSSRSSSRKRRR